jgi:hypothetical protein
MIVRRGGRLSDLKNPRLNLSILEPTDKRDHAHHLGDASHHMTLL